MEFVLTNWAVPDAPDALSDMMRRLDGARYTRWFGSMRRVHLGRNTLFAQARSVELNTSNLIMTGHAFRNHGKTLVHHFQTMGNPGGTADDYFRLNGVYAVVDYGQADQVKVWTDPSGQYHVHIYDQDGLVVVSTNLHMLGVVVEAAGRSLHRDVTGLLFSLSYGTHFGRRSAFREVHLIPPRTMLQLGADGRLSEREYMSQTELFTSPDTYRDNIHNIREILTNTANATLDLRQKTAVDVSGGVDSRTSLAAMLATGRKDEFAVYNLSQRPSPDRLVPEVIVSKFDLTPTDAKVGNQTEDYTMQDRVGRGVYRFCGMRNIDQPDIGELVMPNLTRISGGYGELGYGPAPTKSVWGLKRDGPPAFADNWVRRRTPAEMFLRPDAVDWVADCVTEKVSEALDGGIPLQMIDTVVYAENKAPHHFGMAHRHFNDVRVHIPLLNLMELVQAGTRLKIAQVKNRKVHFDLILELSGPDLALIPLDKKWGQAAVPERLIPHWEQVPKVTVNTPPMAKPFRQSRAGSFASNQPTPREMEFSQKMRKKGLNARFQNAPRYLELLSDTFDRISPQDDIWDILDRNQLERDISQSDDELIACAQEMPYRVGRYAMLAQGLIWYTGQEQPYSVGEDGSGFNA